VDRVGLHVGKVRGGQGDVPPDLCEDASFGVHLVLLFMAGSRSGTRRERESSAVTTGFEMDTSVTQDLYREGVNPNAANTQPPKSMRSRRR
jgi:hypothetical protein